MRRSSNGTMTAGTAPCRVRVLRARHAAFMRVDHARVTGTAARSGVGVPTHEDTVVKRLLEALAEQRWDDHRYYHHSRINQFLHLVSALCFVIAYGLLLVDPASAALLAWGVSMTTRQAGHFFFEPRGYDVINGVTDEYKEAVKIGYNIRRKVILMGAWAASPLVLWMAPSLGGFIAPAGDMAGYLNDVGLAWLAIGLAAVLLRVLQLWWRRSLVTGLVWVLKIATDPFHDIALYWRSPLALLRGERFDPTFRARQ